LKSPSPSSDKVIRVMQSNRRTDTIPEKKIRSALFKRGYRFRKDYLIKTVGTKCRPDVVFPRKKVAVFVDGCFWHGCPAHGTWPKSNADFWRVKIENTKKRDNDNDCSLRETGWMVVRIWEHEIPEEAADKIAEAVRISDG
jgi:DNA mismatch endonuclease, patch repair protein